MVFAAVVVVVLSGVGSRASGVGETLHPMPDTILVARRDLARGVALTAADIDTVIEPRTARRPTPDARCPTIGWLTRRVIRAGEPLRAPAVEPPPLIARGARVTVVWETAGLRVTRDGTAVGAAHRGERVVVRVDGARRLTGVATDAGTVTVVP